MKQKTTYLLSIIVCVVIITTSNIDAQTKLYGTTPSGGSNNLGTFFSMNDDGTNFNVEYNIENREGTSANLSLIKMPDGKIYGSTGFGGDYDNGVIYAYDEVTEIYEVLHSFEHRHVGLTLGSDGKFYGNTSSSSSTSAYPDGSIFSYDITTDTYTTEYVLDDSARLPSSVLLEVEPNIFYGTLLQTNSDNPDEINGALFEFNANTLTFTIKYYFVNNDIQAAPTYLVLGSNGKIYGASEGGTTSGSKLFEYDRTSDIFQVLYDFGGPATKASNAPAELQDGFLYGARSGSGLYKFEKATGTYTNLGSVMSNFQARGSMSKASNGMAYGTAIMGGSSNNGAMYSLDLDTETISVLPNPLNLRWFASHLPELNSGELYCFANDSWVGSFTKLFKYNVNTSNYETLFGFGISTGQSANALTQVEDMLFGFSAIGGNNGGGTIFSLNPETGLHTVLFNFNRERGGVPYGAPVYLNGFLYGTTTKGADNDKGSLFKYEIATNTFTKLYDMDGKNYGSITLASDGKLYGHTAVTDSGFGFIFSYDITTDTYENVYDFTDTDPKESYGFFIEYDGKLYATSKRGGAVNGGTIYTYDLLSGTVAIEHNFESATGNLPTGSLLLASNNKMYGIADNGIVTSAVRVLFEFDPATGTYDIVHNFSQATGYRAFETTLVESPTGKLLGHTAHGGTNDLGVVFAFDPSDDSYTVLKNFDATSGDDAFGHLTLFNMGGTLSTSDIDNNQLFALKAYPNPTSDILNISNPKNVSVKTIQLVNISGQQMFESDQVLESINLKHYPAGIYFLKIDTDMGQKTFKIIKD